MNPREVALNYGMSFIGTPYRWGGSDPINGFDCSGFAQEVLAAVGLDPVGDQTAAQLYASLKHSAVPLDKVPAGGLVFFGASDAGISHVGIHIGNGLMLEAGGGGRTTTTREAAAEQDAYIRIRPIRRRKDLIAAVDPFPANS